MEVPQFSHRPVAAHFLRRRRRARRQGRAGGEGGRKTTAVVINAAVNDAFDPLGRVRRQLELPMTPSDVRRRCGTRRVPLGPAAARPRSREKPDSCELTSPPWHGRRDPGIYELEQAPSECSCSSKAVRNNWPGAELAERFVVRHFWGIIDSLAGPTIFEGRSAAPDIRETRAAIAPTGPIAGLARSNPIAPDVLSTEPPAAPFQPRFSISKPRRKQSAMSSLRQSIENS